MKKAKKMFSKEEFITNARKLTENAMKFYPFYKGKVQITLKFTGKNTRIVQGGTKNEQNV
jgi:hypothetical protein